MSDTGHSPREGPASSTAPNQVPMQMDTGLNHNLQSQDPSLPSTSAPDATPSVHMAPTSAPTLAEAPEAALAKMASRSAFWPITGISTYPSSHHASEYRPTTSPSFPSAHFRSGRGSGIAHMPGILAHTKTDSNAYPDPYRPFNHPLHGSRPGSTSFSQFIDRNDRPATVGNISVALPPAPVSASPGTPGAGLDVYQRIQAVTNSLRKRRKEITQLENDIIQHLDAVGTLAAQFRAHLDIIAPRQSGSQTEDLGTRNVADVMAVSQFGTVDQISTKQMAAWEGFMRSRWYLKRAQDNHSLLKRELLELSNHT